MFINVLILSSQLSDAATLSFDGSQYVRMFSDQESNTQAEDITLRFRTNRPVGLLLSTTSTLSSDRLELALQAGKLRLTVKLGDKDKVSTSFIPIGHHLELVYKEN